MTNDEIERGMLSCTYFIHRWTLIVITVKGRKQICKIFTQFLPHTHSFLLTPRCLYPSQIGIAKGHYHVNIGLIPMRDVEVKRTVGEIESFPRRGRERSSSHFSYIFRLMFKTFRDLTLKYFAVVEPIANLFCSLFFRLLLLNKFLFLTNIKRHKSNPCKSTVAVSSHFKICESTSDFA